MATHLLPQDIGEDGHYAGAHLFAKLVVIEDLRKHREHRRAVQKLLLGPRVLPKQRCRGIRQGIDQDRVVVWNGKEMAGFQLAAQQRFIAPQLHSAVPFMGATAANDAAGAYVAAHLAAYPWPRSP